MLTGVITSSYLQYKADTDAVASWLATTAKKCGYKASWLQREKGTPQGAGRLKGKARKKARAASSDSNGSTTSPPFQSHTIPIKDFVELAQFIVTNKKSGLKVSKSFVSALDGAIAIRKAHGASVNQHLPNTVENLESNERHLHFIGVLEIVRDTLLLLMPRKHTRVNKTGNKPAGITKQSGLFNALEMDEPSEAFLNAPDVTTSAPDKGPTLLEGYEAEKPNDLGEVLFFAQLFTVDIDQIRFVIRETWQGYKSKKYDLLTASLTTNTTLDIARRIEEDVEPIFEELGGLWVLLDYMHWVFCKKTGEDYFHKEKPIDVVNMRVYHDLDLILLPTFRLLNAFCKFVLNTKTPNGATASFGTYDASKSWFDMADREKYETDRINFAGVPTRNLSRFQDYHNNAAIRRYVDDWSSDGAMLYQENPVLVCTHTSGLSRCSSYTGRRGYHGV